MPRVVAIVPTFNRRKLFADAVRSVLDQTVPPELFIILDNGSSDGTSEDLAALQKDRPTGTRPRIVVHRKPENLGASGGMRFLFDEALLHDPDWIWVMDDDAIAAPTALEELLNAPEAQDPEAYILESTIIDQNKEWSLPNRPARFNAESFQFEGLTEKEFEAAARAKRGLSVNSGGYCGLLVRSRAFREFGFPRAEFYLWYDDVEFVLRVSMVRKAYLIPQSRIQHFAQALVPHETLWPFTGPVPKVPLTLAWRYYYLNRNWLWMAKAWLPPHRYALFWSKHMARNLAAPVLMQQDHLAERLGLAARAGFDALFNRLGKRVGPNPK